MRKIILYIAITLAACVLYSCEKISVSLEETMPEVSESQVNTSSDIVTMSFTAIADNDVETKTSLSGTSVTWAANENIYIYDGCAPRLFSNGEDTGSEVSFSGSAKNATEYFAVYPNGIQTDERIITATIPTFQTATANSFAVKSNVAAAYTKSSPTDENVLHFKNMGAVVKFKISNTGIRKVRLEAINGEKMTGDFTISYAADGTMTRSIVNAKSQSCAIMQSTGDFATDKYYYFVIHPNTYANGFRITLFKSNGSYKSMSNSAENTLERNQIMDFGTLPEITKWNTGGSWEKVDDESNFVGGQYIIVSYDDAYYVPNTEVTSAGPTATAVTKSSGNIVVSDDMIWNAAADNDGLGLIFSSNANSNHLLWGATANNGVRVTNSVTGGGANSVWKAVDNDDYGIIAYAALDGSDEKYLATYGTADWRNYKSGSLSSSNRPANFYRFVPEGAPVDPSVPSRVFTTSDKTPSNGKVAKDEGSESSFVINSNIPWSVSVNNEAAVEYSSVYVDETHTRIDVMYYGIASGGRTINFTITPSDGGASEIVSFTQGEDNGPWWTDDTAVKNATANTFYNINTHIKYKTTAGTSDSNHIRINKSSNLVIEAASGYGINQVVLTDINDDRYRFSTTNTVTVATGASASKSYSAPVGTITITGETSTVTINATANQMRISKIKVQYHKTEE